MPPSASASSCAWRARSRCNRPPAKTVAWAKGEGAKVLITADPREAASGADCIVTDTWVSMGSDPKLFRPDLLAPYRVDEKLMACAKRDAIFMHCLPAKRGEEVTAGVIDGPQSVVWDEAENRMHAQKAIVLMLLGGAKRIPSHRNRGGLQARSKR